MLVGGTRGQRIARPCNGFGKPFVVNGLQQVIQRVRLKRPERELVVGGHEYRRRHVAGREMPQHLEAIHPGHLHVEEHQVRAMLTNRLQCFAPVPALRTHFDIVVGRKPNLEAAPGQLFVINDQALEHRLSRREC